MSRFWVRVRVSVRARVRVGVVVGSEGEGYMLKVRVSEGQRLG